MIAEEMISTTPRRILHIDMDAFFASVEQRDNPALRGKPLIVGGNRDDVRGVVSTASYEARQFGVHSAMPIARARQLCPHGIFMRGNHARYREISRQVKEILLEVTPLVEMASIDEAYLDITGSLSLFGGDDGVGAYLKQNIQERCGVPCTLAIASNKLVAKIGSGEAKPDGYLSIPEGEEASWLAPLAVSKLPGAGKRTCEILEGLGIDTLGQLAAVPMNRLERRLGTATAYQLQRRARGISNSPVVPERVRKSISRETTFSTDNDDWDGMEARLIQFAGHCAAALRAGKLDAGRVMLKVRYHDFETRTFSKQLREPTALDQPILEALRELIPKARKRPEPVRLIGMGLESLRASQKQLDLFNSGEEDQQRRMSEAADALRSKLGATSLRPASALEK